MGIKTRRAAFVVPDMRVLVAQDRAERRARAARARELAAVPVATHMTATSVSEKARERLIQPVAEAVAVIGGVDLIGRGQGGHHFGADPSCIVGNEAHASRT